MRQLRDWRMHHEPGGVCSAGVSHLSLNATPMAVRAALESVREIWRTGGIAEEVCKTAEQVLAEVLNNIVEHAYAGRTDGVVQLQTRPANCGIYCKVHDDGAPMPNLVLPDGDLADHNGELQSLPEGGFGWFMIRSLTDDLRYCRREGRNYLRFVVTDSNLP